MNKLFDFLENHPILSLVGFWTVGAVLSLALLAVAVLIVVAILSGFGIV